MGQKVMPTGFRLGVKIKSPFGERKNVEDWRSRWYAPKRHFARLLLEDQRIRRHVKKYYYPAGVSKVEIERSGNAIKVIVHCSRPGVIIGRKGAKVDKLTEELQAFTAGQMQLAIMEITKPELDAQLVAEAIAEQLEKRQSFRRVMKKAIETSRNAGALGIKIIMSGRIGGAEIARCEEQGSGKVPLTTLRADINYGFTEAKTGYGNIGVKVWVYRGEVFGEEHSNESDAKTR